MIAEVVIRRGVAIYSATDWPLHVETREVLGLRAGVGDHDLETNAYGLLCIGLASMNDMDGASASHGWMATPERRGP